MDCYKFNHNGTKNVDYYFNIEKRLDEKELFSICNHWGYLNDDLTKAVGEAKPRTDRKT